MIGLIATDMDGTLLSPDQTISPFNLEALHDAGRAGIHLAVASGRAPFEIALLTAALCVPLGLISLNGAYVRTPDGREDRHPLPPGDFIRCVEMAEEAGVRYYFYTMERLHSNLPGLKGYAVPLRVVEGAQARALADQAMKFVVYAPEDMAKLAKLRARIEAMGLSVCSSWEGNFEVNAPGVDKGSALSEMAALLGVEQERVMAVGDQENDLSMLRWAGVSVAMGNAIREVREAAGHSTTSHAEDGVGRAIRRLALG